MESVQIRQTPHEAAESRIGPKSRPKPLRNTAARRNAGLRGTAAALLAAILLCGGAWAAENGARIQGYVPGEQSLSVFLSGLGEDVDASKRLAFSLGADHAEIADIETLQDQPITYYCLTDASGTLTQDRLAREKEALLAISNQLTREDRMVITRPGAETEPEYLWDKDVLTAQIRAVSVQQEGADLYGAIVSSLENLSTSENASARKCLVVLSGVWRDAETTRAQAEAAIDRYRIPVYGVALMKVEALEEERGVYCAETLRDLALRSAGGAYFRPETGGGEDAGSGIVSDMKHDLLVRLNLSRMNRALLSQEALTLTVHYDSGETLLTDTMDIRTDKLLSGWPVEEPEAAEPEVREPSGALSWLWIAAVLVLLIAAILLLLPGKKASAGSSRRRTASRTRTAVRERRSEAPRAPSPPEGVPSADTASPSAPDHAPPAEPSPASGDPPFSGDFSAEFSGDFSDEDSDGFSMDFTRAVFEEPSAPADPASASVDSAPAPDAQDTAVKDAVDIWDADLPVAEGWKRTIPEGAGRPVTFAAIGYPEIRFLIHIPERKTLSLGRNHGADLVLNPEDRKLSGVHCRVRLSGSAMRVWDAGSTNGTSVNGVPIPPGGSALLEDGQTLRAGSYEYRVHLGDGAK